MRAPLRSWRTGDVGVSGRAYTRRVPRDHHRPVHFTDQEFAAIQGGEDPALVNRVAHETANALLHRVRQDRTRRWSSVS